MRLRSVFVAVLFACFAQAQDGTSERARLASILDFELGAQAGGAPVGWGGDQNGTIFADDKTVHGGKWSVRIERDARSQEGYSNISKTIPIDFTGKSLELRGFVRTENVSGYVGLLMQEDGDVPRLEFDNMQSRHVNGTADWTEYSIKLPLRPAAKRLSFGFLLVGTGKTWVDDMKFLVDGRPVWEVPAVERLKTPLELDHEFDLGSNISMTALTPLQIQTLVTLGKVWGFLKYHHLAVTDGTRQWDYDLFRVLPEVLAARDRASANIAMLQWVNRLGTVAPCVSCVGLNTSDVQMRPDIDWISRESVLGKELSILLTGIYRARTEDNQFYVASLFPGVGNPIFQELGYKDVRFPDSGYQLLALYRFWNIIEYWFPYRDVLGEDWDQVLAEFIPRLALAKGFDSYQLELQALIVRAHDTHAALSSAPQIRPPVGNCQLPLVVRFVENQPVVAASSDSGVQPGDVLVELDGKPVAGLITDWMPYYNGSNDAARLRGIAFLMIRGGCGPVSVRVRRENESLEINTLRSRPSPQNVAGRTHDLPGDTFRLLSPEVGYLKLSSVKASDAGHYIESAAGTKGLVIDIRNYPSEFVAYALGQLLVDRETPFVRYTAGDLSNPWSGPRF